LAVRVFSPVPHVTLHVDHAANFHAKVHPFVAVHSSVADGFVSAFDPFCVHLYVLACFELPS
jgi:hypothetical protein